MVTEIVSPHFLIRSHQIKKAEPVSTGSKKLDAKTRFHCGTTSHFANSPECQLNISNADSVVKLDILREFVVVLYPPAMSKKLLCLTFLSIEIPLSIKQNNISLFPCTLMVGYQSTLNCLWILAQLFLSS